MEEAVPIRATAESTGRVVVDLGEQEGTVDGPGLGKWLCGPSLTASTVTVRNGRLGGLLDLSGVTLGYGLELSGLMFEHQPLLTELRSRRLTVAGCEAPGIDLARCMIDVLRIDHCTITGAIDLDSARIEQGFGIHDSTLGDGQRALLCTWLRANGSTGLARVTTQGMIDFLGAHVDGELWLEDLDATAGQKPCLRVDLASLTGSLKVQGTARGELSLSHVTVNGDLDLRECIVDGPAKAVTADSARIAGRALLGGAFKASGRVLLVAAEVRDLDLRGATVGHVPVDPDEMAVDLDRLVCRNDVDLTGATITGGLRAEGALIGGDLTVKAAEIASTDPAKRPAVSLVNTVVSGTLLVEDTSIVGGVKAPGLEAKNAALIDSTIVRPGGMALSLLHARIATQLKLRGLRVTGDITLVGASTSELDDEADVWLHPRTVDLDGFTYRWLRTEGVELGDRLRWLQQRPKGEQPRFRPGTYDALASAYRAQGEPQLAIRTLIARENDRLRSTRPTTARAAVPWLARQVLRVAVAHGYRPGRALGLLGVLVVALTALFAFGPGHAGALHSTGSPPAPLSTFNPFVFSLDTILPVIDFGEAGNWRVDPIAPWAWLYRSAVWVSIGAGWILSTLLLAAVATLSRSDS